MPNEMSTRAARVGSAFAWEVAKHTTERDREIAWLLYRQKILTTDQLVQQIRMQHRRRDPRHSRRVGRRVGAWLGCDQAVLVTPRI